MSDVVRRAAPRLPTGPVLLAGLSLAAYLVVALILDMSSFTDLHVYRAEGSALIGGRDLYGPLEGVHGLTTYPPFAALLFVPTAFVPVAPLEILAVVGNLALLLVVSWQSVRRVRGSGPGTFPAACVLAAVGLWAEPVTTTLFYGQINLLLLALVLADFGLPAGSRFRGVGVGLAAGIKVTPGILIVYLVLTGRWRAAGTAVATLLVTVGLTALVDADATWTYWTGHLFDLGRAGRLENAANQSVRGWLVRADHTRDTRPAELLLVVVVLVAGLACAVLAHRYLGDAWGLLAAAVTGLLVSPISWSHHWIWCVPVLALLWYQARIFVVPLLLVFWSHAVWAVPHGDSVELTLTGGEVARSGLYVVVGLGFLALAAWRVHLAREQLVDPADLVVERRPLPAGQGAER
jgi:alpha-1,2-mannosyltransferase